MTEFEKEIVLTWEDYRLLLQNICESITKFNNDNGIKFNSIYGIPRGGYIPAVCLSYYFNISMVKHKEDLYSNALIVDDILDSGTTISEILENLDKSLNFKTASIVLNKSSKIGVDFYSFYNSTNKWIQFPYEVPNQKDTVSKVKKEERIKTK